MLTVRGEKVQVNRETFIKWYRLGKLFVGHLEGQPYVTPYGEVMTALPYHGLRRIDWAHLICEDDIVDVDPYIRYRPESAPVPNPNLEEWRRGRGYVQC